MNSKHISDMYEKDVRKYGNEIFPLNFDFTPWFL